MVLHTRRRARRPAMLLLVATATVLLGLGLALGVSAAGPDDRATAEGLIREVESAPAGRKEAAADLVARARAALDRAARLRAEGDEPHARLADGLARTWAEAARDTLRAVELEERAANARRAATDAGTMADRERALLEEGLAQSGRLRAQLEALEREAKDQPAKTSTKAGTDAGAARTAAPQRAAAKDGGAR